MKIISGLIAAFLVFASAGGALSQHAPLSANNFEAARKNQVQDASGKQAKSKPVTQGTTGSGSTGQNAPEPKTNSR